MNKKYIQLGVGILVSALFIWLAFHLGSISLSELWQALKKTNWLFAIPMVIITMASFYWRGIRWRLLLLPGHDIPASRLYPPLMIGFAFNNILPARAGELTRPYALMKQEKVPFTTGLLTVFVERIVDVVTLLVLLVLLPVYVKLDPTVSKSFGDLTINATWIEARMPALSVVSAIALLMLGTFMIPQVKNLYRAIIMALSPIPLKVRSKLSEIVESVSRGLECLKNPRVLTLVAIHSVIIWFSVAFSFQVMSWGFPGVTITFPQALAFLVVSCLVISIPSSPGFWGLYEFGGLIALLMMGVVPDTPEGNSAAFAFTAVVHFLQWVPITAYGLFAAGRLSISADDARAASEAPAAETIAGEQKSSTVTNE